MLEIEAKLASKMEERKQTPAAPVEVEPRITEDNDDFDIFMGGSSK